MSELEIAMISDFRSYNPHRVLWTALRVPNGLSERRRLTMVGRGHAVAR